MRISTALDSRRRSILRSALAVLVLADVRSGWAQAQSKLRRIGVLSPFAPADVVQWHRALHTGLRELGWHEGKNLVVEYRFAHARNDRLPELAAELVRLKAEAIVADTTSAALAAKNATRSIPIVVASGGDTVATGLVDSLARPGGNVTGLDQISPELGGKRLELLKELVPKLLRVGVIWNPRHQASSLNWKELQQPARKLGLELFSFEAGALGDIENAFDEFVRARVGAVAVMPDPVFVTNLKRIAMLAEARHLPAIFHLREFAEFGGLVTYGPDRTDLFRRSAVYVDKILKGARPTDLPVEQPTKFELALNFKTAKALGIVVPPTVMVRVDRIIQ